MAKRLVILFSVVASLLLASTSTLAAQTPTADVLSIADAVNNADPADILAGLETPMRDRDLPDGFSDAEYVDISSDATPTDAEDCLYDAAGLDQVEGAAGYAVVGEPSDLGYIYVCASINYVLFEDGALGDTPLEDFKSGIESGLGDAGEGTPDASGGLAVVTDVTVAGEDAVLLTYTLEDSGATAVVQTLAIPVGNVFVISVVSVADTGDVDADDIETFANDLTVSGINHLGAVAEDAQ